VPSVNPISGMLVTPRRTNPARSVAVKNDAVRSEMLPTIERDPSVDATPAMVALSLTRNGTPANKPS
jgi:hypothetical protein